MGERKLLAGKPSQAVHRSVAAVSVGIIDGEPRLDLSYVEDAKAEVDMNIVCTGSGDFVEVQGTGEAGVFSGTSSTSCWTWESPAANNWPCCSARLWTRSDMSKRLLLATRNAGKLVELQRILDAALGSGTVELVGLSDVEPYDELPETGLTLVDNALIKARERGPAHWSAHGGGRLGPRRWTRCTACPASSAPVGVAGTATTGPTWNCCWPRSPMWDDESRGAGFLSARRSSCVFRSAGSSRWRVRCAGGLSVSHGAPEASGYEPNLRTGLRTSYQC